MNNKIATKVLCESCGVMAINHYYYYLAIVCHQITLMRVRIIWTFSKTWRNPRAILNYRVFCELWLVSYCITFEDGKHQKHILSGQPTTFHSAIGNVLLFFNKQVYILKFFASRDDAPLSTNYDGVYLCLCVLCAMKFQYSVPMFTRNLTWIFESI